MTRSPKLGEKTWSPAVEEPLYRQWEEEGIYKFDPSSGREVFTIDTPPPYPSGRPWHIGAAAHYSQIDMIARTARMKGFEVWFPIGIDRNGLPVELYTERRYQVSITRTSREEFIRLCRDALDELEDEMVGIMRAMGTSGYLNRRYRTDSTEYRTLTQSTFIELWNKGLIYSAKRPNNYCQDCRTTIADAEVVYEERPTKLVYIRFPVKEGGEILIATTRPELLPSCALVIFNQDDSRYQGLQGKHAIVPLYGREAEIRSHPAAKPEFGSGLEMVCSYGDYADLRLFRELGLSEIISISQEGTMNENSGPYGGLSVMEARRRIVADLMSAGFLAGEEEIIHRTPVCERSKTVIEILPMDELYLKQVEFVPTMLELAKQLIFHPEEHRKILLNWINSVTMDWPITRRRYYATEVPLWHCRSCGSSNAPEPGRYYRPWKDPAPFQSCPRCGSLDLGGDERTLDTWMDSSVSPLYVSSYQKNSEFFKATYPASIRPQAKDIVRTWLYYTLLRCYQLTGKPPFSHAWIMGYGVDEKGERMSKSKGNVTDPYPILLKYGGDTFRFWAASEANLGFDFRCSEERIAGAQKFMTKLWNVSRFISHFPGESCTAPNDHSLVKAGLVLKEADRWILGELSNLVEECMKGYDDFNFYIPANKIREFAWSVFSSHYVEMVKARAYYEDEGARAAWFTLHHCLSCVLLMLSPICPFITDAIWRRLYGERSIHAEKFPKPSWSRELGNLTSELLRFNSQVWNKKKAQGLSLKDPVKMEIPEALMPFRDDLVSMHRIQS